MVLRTNEGSIRRRIRIGAVVLAAVVVGSASIADGEAQVPVAVAGAPTAVAGATSAASRAAALPTLSGVEFRELFNRYEPVPGSVRLKSAPPITGNTAADAHIRAIAIRRGYRLRSQHTAGLSTVLGVPLDSVAAGQLAALARRANQAGYGLGAGYGYRSVDLQRSIFLGKIGGYSASQIANGAADGVIETVLKRVAAPGFSKHQSGMAVDLRSSAGGGSAFGGSGVGQWMAANNYAVAKEYGFIPSYPPGAGAQGPDPEPWEYVYVGRRAIECAVPLVRQNDRVAFENCMGTSAIARKYAALGGAKGFLGPIVAAERINSDKRGRVARYQHGNIYWTPTTGAFEVHGAILDRFGQQGGVNGSLRYPTSDTRASSDGRSRYSNFEGGRIYYRGAAGTFAVPQPFFAKHESMGGVRSVLGYPTGSVTSLAGGRVRSQAFEHGRIYVEGGVAREVHGAAFDRYAALGGGSGPLGFPRSDLVAAGDGRGKVQWFERGLLVYSPATGAHGLWGATLGRYSANGGVRSSLRYPTSEPIAVGDGRGLVTTFERGRIYATTATGAHDVHGAVLRVYLDDLGGPSGSLGYPTSELDPSGTPGGRYQAFEHGRLRFIDDAHVEPA